MAKIFIAILCFYIVGCSKCVESRYYEKTIPAHHSYIPKAGASYVGNGQWYNPAYRYIECRCIKWE